MAHAIGLPGASVEIWSERLSGVVNGAFEHSAVVGQLLLAFGGVLVLYLAVAFAVDTWVVYPAVVRSRNRAQLERGLDQVEQTADLVSRGRVER